MLEQDGHENRLPPDLAILLDAIRQEFESKLSTLRAQGIAALLGGGALGGLVSALVSPHNTAHTASSIFYYVF